MMSGVVSASNALSQSFEVNHSDIVVTQRDGKCSDPMARIVPMDASSVQRIVAGQAIFDLASAVKESVDNALDAGSKTINIRLFNQGLDIVEVSDDGCGVPIESRPFMATKHATSKIRDFSDIYSTDSLGFRGEALFCLANISANLVVATRTADEALGQKLEFTRDGYLRNETVSPVPRKIGTTVAVVKLFDALPVRRADLEKRLQVQRRDVFLMMQGYAIHSLGVKFNVFDICSSGREELRLSTMHGTTRLEETISSVLGSTFLSGMSRISLALELDDSKNWRIEGLISKAPNLTARDGSVARNAQFFCINGRPVELPKISRVISDVWRKLETTSKKKPACILQLTLPKSSFDVNLSPSKRHVHLADEKKICDLIRDGVDALWCSQRDGKFFSNELEIQGRNLDDPSHVDNASPSGRKVKRRLGFYNDFRRVKLQHDKETSQLQGRMVRCTNPTPPPVAVTPSEAFGESMSFSGANQGIELEDESFRLDPLKGEKPTNADRQFFHQVQESFRRKGAHDETKIFGLESTLSDNRDSSIKPSKQYQTNENVDECMTAQRNETDRPANEARHRPCGTRSISLKNFGFQPMKKARLAEEVTPARAVPESSASVLVEARSRQLEHDERLISPNTTACDGQHEELLLQNESKNADPGPTVRAKKGRVQWDVFQGTDSVVQGSRDARLVLRDLRMRLRDVNSDQRKDENTTTELETFDVGHHADDESDTAQSTSIISLTKQDFEDMKVIGQFNLGFILVKCRNHLWVLDQHACDEKYNFERLCATTVIHEQKLLAPIPLELSPSEEACIMENRETFAKNGFRFQYNADKAPRQRFALISLPHSGARDGRKAVQFGKDDVHALCAVLGADGSSYSPQDGGTGVDGSGIYGNNAVRRYAGVSQNGERAMLRIPKAVAMFANRACRGSVMIGTALSIKEMETIVTRLGSVDHPWTCPHGRPTLKHVKDLLGTELEDARRTLKYSVGPTLSTMTELTQPEGDGKQE